MEGTNNKKTTGRKLPPKPLKSWKTQPTTERPAVACGSQEAHDPINEDEKKMQRTIAKRECAQRTRLRQQLYVIELEEQVNFLKGQRAAMIRTIKQVDCQNSMMKANNASMKQKLSEYSGEMTSKEAEYEELQKEKETLKKLYADQQQK